MTYENYIKAKLVDVACNAAYHYGDFESVMAIAQVMANRVNAGWHGGDWKGVIDDAEKLAGTDQTPPKLNPRDLLFRRILSQIDDIYYGTADDSGVNVDSENGITPALYYAELHNITNDWFRDNITSDLANHPRLATVGQLTFFG
jgi:hypothetical protein